MHVKTYKGSDAQAALAKVKAELGEDAIILGTKTVRTGGVQELRDHRGPGPRRKAAPGNRGRDPRARPETPCTSQT